MGVNDGWTDLSDNYRMDWEYDYAPNGNLALMGKLDLSQGHEFTLALALGSSLHIASNNLFQSLANGFDKACETLSPTRPARPATTSARTTATPLSSRRSSRDSTKTGLI